MGIKDLDNKSMIIKDIITISLSVIALVISLFTYNLAIKEYSIKITPSIERSMRILINETEDGGFKVTPLINYQIFKKNKLSKLSFIKMDNSVKTFYEFDKSNIKQIGEYINTIFEESNYKNKSKYNYNYLFVIQEGEDGNRIIEVIDSRIKYDDKKTNVTVNSVGLEKIYEYKNYEEKDRDLREINDEIVNKYEDILKHFKLGLSSCG